MLENALRSSEQDCEVRTLAQERTLTVLSSLDPARKKIVLRFLCEEEREAP